MNIKAIDFNELYKQQKQATTFAPKGKDDWDKKAPSLNKRVHKSIYNDELLKHINLDGCNTLLDVGCGVGNLSLKFAKKLKEVYSLDFSPKMLEIVQENATTQNISNIKTINLSWYDSWQDINKTDIVLASRSMEVKDMKKALLKLNNQANKRVYLTYKVGGSFLDDDILKAMDRQIIKKPDYIYILNILYSLGINASLNFIKSEGRSSIYKDEKSFINSVDWSLDGITKEEKIKLQKFYKENKEEKELSSKYVHWALISWEK